MEPEAFLVLLEIFFPLIGVIIIVMLAKKTQGIQRWLVLVFGPALLMSFHFLSLKFDWIDGNLLTAAIFGIMMMAVYYYYIILLIIGAVKGWNYWRKSK